MGSDTNYGLTRRDLLKASGGTALVVATAGCLESSSNEPTENSPSTKKDGGGDGNQPSGKITIGMVDSLTGTLAPYGQRNQRARKLAVPAINDAGIGSNDRPLEVIVEDDESTNQGGVNAARKLVNQDGVPLLIGSVGSGVSLAIYKSVVESTDVVQISQNSTSPALSKEPELLRMSPSGAAKGKALAKLIAKKHDSVAVTWINNDYGSGLADVFADSFEGTVAYNGPHDQGQSSYRGILAEMASTNATAWLFLTYAAEFTVMINESYDQGYYKQVDYYGAESTIAESILKNTPPGSQESMVGITESAPKDQKSYQQFRKAFESKYGVAPTVWSAYTYDALTVAAIAIHTAAEVSGAAIGKVVKDITRPSGQKVYSFAEAKDVLSDGTTDVNYEGVSGPVDLDENGDPPGFYQIYRVKDHEYVFGDYITS